MTTTEQVRLAGYTTLRLGGPAARFTVAATVGDLVDAVAAADRDGEPVLVLGGGSNLVVADAGFPGVVVRAASDGLQFAGGDETVEVTAAAGQDWDELVRRCLAEGLSGVECLSGIPGSAGATPIQNVGAYGQEVAETIASVQAYDRAARQVVLLGPGDLGFGYRTSMFKRQAAAASSEEAARAGVARAGGGPLAGVADVGGGPRAGVADAGSGPRAGPASGDSGARMVTLATGRFVVLQVTFRLPVSPLSAPIRYVELGRLLGVGEGGRVPVADARAAVLELRRGKGMLLDEADADSRSAGSFFTNPVVPADLFEALNGRLGAVRIPRWPAGPGQTKLSAAWLIEQAGFSKGFGLADDPAGARISTKHTLALTNPGEATTAGLIRLARTIRDGVRAEFGIELTSEPTLVGVTL